ncbi:MAG: hypothetical protein CM1200mP1_03550 [Candidatus Neomarinimicrobiota bacterium]|nr:MAG: hypothetical protein CM1200mP1_03550 [Candidatus Neomarinimicrobiota bacterium]
MVIQLLFLFLHYRLKEEKGLVKFSAHTVEEGRISIRNIRRDIIHSVKRVEKENRIPEDDIKRFFDDLQDLTDKFIGKLNTSQESKEKEILEN